LDGTVLASNFQAPVPSDGGVIRFERHLRYPIRDVLDAITNPARLAEW
jgi:uncharacterized protein YndB with AHSA1/START domain